MAEISLARVSKRFGTVEVIRDVSLDVASGELVVFLGPSGSGKTTLLRMIAGLETIDDGRADDRRGAVGRRCRRAAQPGDGVPELRTLSAHDGGGEHGVRAQEHPRAGRGRSAERVAEAARMLEMEALLERRPSELSGGQRQRVAIGRAIVKEPKAFLFDEPLSNLDAALRARTRVELAELHQRLKSTMIYVTHDQVEAMTLADRIVVLNDCRIEQVGTPMEVYTRPASRFVAGFVGLAGDELPEGDAVGQRRPAAGAAGGRRRWCRCRASRRRRTSVELGVRPEALTVVAEGGETEGTATVVERLGERTLVHVRLRDGTQVTAQDRGISTVEPGETVRLKFDTSALHLFGEDGRAWHAA